MGDKWVRTRVRAVTQCPVKASWRRKGLVKVGGSGPSWKEREAAGDTVRSQQRGEP